LVFAVQSTGIAHFWQNFSFSLCSAAPMTFPIELRSAPPSVTIANLKFSISNFQFRREICDDAVLVAACRAVALCLCAGKNRREIRRPA
jgi:hypothetical protein